MAVVKSGRAMKLSEEQRFLIRRERNKAFARKRKGPTATQADRDAIADYLTREPFPRSYV